MAWREAACRAVARARLRVAEAILDLAIVLLEGRVIGPVGGLRLAHLAGRVAGLPKRLRAPARLGQGAEVTLPGREKNGDRTP
ncbi:hypothetical protein [Elioraea thermophila]|uniref:hypothetical protein n=1 Tax=Elioraea thermophila TaxID=2185104 RepID=UPI000DF2E3DD|nr:hypothetical protein [Elioraea thermophila]